MMPGNPDWMRPVDDEILQHATLHGVAKPKRLQARTELTAAYMGERCETLARYGLLEQYDFGVFVPTLLAKRYLCGVLDPDDLARLPDDEMYVTFEWESDFDGTSS